MQTEKTTPEAGMTGSSSLKVTPAHTALALGSGDMEVLSTPILTAVMENAAMLAVKPALSEGQTTVGSMIQTTHLRPTPVGDTITATAMLTAIDGRKLTFAVSAADSRGLIGEGTHVRYIVDRKRFLEKMNDARSK